MVGGQPVPALSSSERVREGQVLNGAEVGSDIFAGRDAADKGGQLGVGRERARHQRCGCPHHLRTKKWVSNRQNNRQIVKTIVKSARNRKEIALR